MTSSEANGASPAPRDAASGAADGASAPHVLLAGYMHPWMLFFTVVEAVRVMFLPAILGLFIDPLWFGVAVGLFGLNVIFGLARYLTFRYELTDEELITREGILHRQERRVPVNRIQDLGLESTIVRRVFGLVLVTVETASGAGAEIRLDSIGKAQAEYLRQCLYRARQQQGGATPEAAAAAAQPQEYLLHKAGSQELFVRGLTNTRLGAALVLLGFIYEVWDQLGMAGGLGITDLLEKATVWLGGLGTGVAVLVLAAAVLLFLIVALVISVTASMVRFHGFTLSWRDHVLVKRFGLLTTRNVTLPLRKVQRVVLEQNLLRRLIGLVEIKADTAGSAMSDGNEAASGRDLVVPCLPVARGDQVVPSVLPGLLPWTLRWRRVSPKLVPRVTMVASVWAAILLLALLPTVGWWGLFAVALPPLGWAMGQLEWRNAGWAWQGDHIGLRWGIVGRYRSLVPLRKVQAVVLEAGPIERLLGLASLTVFVAGGSPSRFRNLTREDAESLREAFAAAASELTPGSAPEPATS